MKKLLLITAAIVILFLALRLIRLVYVPNLLANPGFETGGAAGWQVAGEGSPQVAANPAAGDSGNALMRLTIPETTEGSWVGVGQQVAVKPDKPHRLTINYRLAPNNQGSAIIVLRLSQYNAAGELLASQDVSPTEAGSPLWQTFDYSFITHPAAATAEIGVAIVGPQAAAVDIDNLQLTYPTWLEPMTGATAASILAGVLVITFAFMLLRPVLRRQIAAARLLPGWRLAMIVAVNLVLLAVFAELVALALYFYTTGRLFYTHKKLYLAIGQEAADAPLTHRRIHPYFGYVDAPGWTQSSTSPVWQLVADPLKMTNNHGFISNYDYPFIKTANNQYIIGIFGGSVAEFFALSARDELITNLQSDAFFADKEIIVLNFAKGGYKQPQQLLLLTYFLSIGQKFDLIINLDGFNEVAFGYRYNEDRLDPTMPHGGIIQGLSGLTQLSQLTPAKIDALAQINRDKARLNQLAKTINSTYLASASFVLEQYYAMVFNQYNQQLNRFDQPEDNASEESILFLKRNNTPLNETDLFEQITRTWALSSIMMHNISQSQQFIYIHVLQPNQYYSLKKFSAEEINIAVDQTYWEKTAVEKGYPALLEQTQTLAENNVNFYNAVPIFDRETHPVYIDACCHYNELGNQILARFIANAIVTRAYQK